jgi:hypothetical protein
VLSQSSVPGCRIVSWTADYANLGNLSKYRGHDVRGSRSAATHPRLGTQWDRSARRVTTPVQEKQFTDERGRTGQVGRRGDRGADGVERQQ